MARFKLDDYETVEQRLHRFWAAHPNGRIATDLTHHSVDNFDAVIFRADVWKDATRPHPDASGWAEEHRKVSGGGPNVDCWVENCETSAIGRALANLGMSGNKRATREEMRKAARQDERQTPTPDRKKDNTKQLALGRMRSLFRKKDGYLPISEVLGRPVQDIADMTTEDINTYTKHLSECSDKLDPAFSADDIKPQEG
jgi:hypothetical protein